MRRSSSALTTVNSLSGGAMSPTSPEPAAARNISPFFTRNSLAFESSEYQSYFEIFILEVAG